MGTRVLNTRIDHSAFAYVDGGKCKLSVGHTSVLYKNIWRPVKTTIVTFQREQFPYHYISIGNDILEVKIIKNEENIPSDII